MAESKCSCCGMAIEPGALNHVQLGAVDILDAACDAFAAARETLLQNVIETAKVTVERTLNLVSQVQAHAPPEQQAAIREALARADAKLRTVEPS